MQSLHDKKTLFVSLLDYNSNKNLFHILKMLFRNQGCGVGVVVAGSWRFLGGVGVGFLRTLGWGVGIGIFLSDSDSRSPIE